MLCLEQGKTSLNIFICKAISGECRKGCHAAFGVEECWNQSDSSTPKLNIVRKKKVPDKVPDKVTKKWYYLHKDAELAQLA